jgi:uncharacterized lipoprotein YddW (UPF0748 family)
MPFLRLKNQNALAPYRVWSLGTALWAGSLLVLLLLILLLLSGIFSAWADPVTPTAGQVRLLNTPNETTPLTLDGKNQVRQENQLILYTPAYGSRTETNPYGVEVQAKRRDKLPTPLASKPGAKTGEVVFEVTQVNSVYSASKLSQSANPSQYELSAHSGNTPIPTDGVVLSASGNKRDVLMTRFPIGQTFALMTSPTLSASIPVDVANPTPETNPRGKTYPGLRASHQLLLYTRQYGAETTGTNEFGYEVTVVDGRVVEAEGANSRIPESGFVLSGHGRMRDWLAKHAPVGASVQFNPQTRQLTTQVDASSYRFQLGQLLQTLNGEAQSNPQVKALTQRVRDTLQEAEALEAKGQSQAAIDSLLSLKPECEAALWKLWPRYPEAAVKGVWHRPQEKGAQAIGQKLDDWKKAGLNTVFLETFYHGYPIFPSNTYTRYQIASNQYPQFKGSDLLATWLDQAHQRGMKVHAWCQLFYVGNDQVEGQGPILQKYPGWANWQRSAATAKKLMPSTLEPGSYFLDPANPEVKHFLLTLLEEMMTRYPLDGVQLDYIRYPASFPPERFSYVATTWGYSPATRSLFKQKTGADPLALDPKKEAELWQQWQDFKTGQINDFVQDARALQKRVQAKRKQTAPTLQLSAAVFPGTQGKLTKHQDWRLWQQQGWIDALAPMNLTGSVEAVYGSARQMKFESGSSAVQVWSGVFSPFNRLETMRMMQQLQAAKRGGAEGYVLFNSTFLKPSDKDALGLWQSSPLASPGKNGVAQQAGGGGTLIPSSSGLTVKPPSKRGLFGRRVSKTKTSDKS